MLYIISAYEFIESGETEMKDNFSDRFVEMFINRLRFVFSPETFFLYAILLLLFKVPGIGNWLNPPWSFTKHHSEIIRSYRQHQNITHLRVAILCIAIMVIVFGIGELIRRRLKRKSLIFNNEKKNKS